MKHIHGGDIYADNWNEEPLDFSANINPLGMTDSVREAAQQAIAGCLHYPDPFCRAALVKFSTWLTVMKLFI